MQFDGFPVVLSWELTLACNLRCRHCGSDAGRPRPRELSTSEALALCDQFPELLVQEVDFTGGEPLIRPDWWQIAARLSDHDIQTQIISNGLALTDDIVARMRDVNVSAVGVSLDGTERTHDSIRAYPGLFGRVMAGIERLKKAGIPATVITTVTGLNMAELPDMIEVLRRAGISRWQLQPLFPIGRGVAHDDLRVDAASYCRFGQFVREWIEIAASRGVELILADSYGYFTELDPRSSPWRGCPAGLVTCGIMSDGRVKGCLSMPDDRVEGDLRQTDLWSLWFRPDAFAYNRRFSKADLGPACAGCDQYETCKGGCSAMSLGSSGQFHNDAHCFLGIRRRQNGS